MRKIYTKVGKIVRCLFYLLLVHNEKLQSLERLRGHLHHNYVFFSCFPVSSMGRVVCMIRTRTYRTTKKSAGQHYPLFYILFIRAWREYRTKQQQILIVLYRTLPLIHFKLNILTTAV